MRKFDRDASQTRDFWVAKNATLRAARPGPSTSKIRSPQDDNRSAPLVMVGAAKRFIGRRVAHQGCVFATPPSTLLARGTQVGPPHFRWRWIRTPARGAREVREGSYHKREVDGHGFSQIGLRLTVLAKSGGGESQHPHPSTGSGQAFSLKKRARNGAPVVVEMP